MVPIGTVRVLPPDGARVRFLPGAPTAPLVSSPPDPCSGSGPPSGPRPFTLPPNGSAWCRLAQSAYSHQTGRGFDSCLGHRQAPSSTKWQASTSPGPVSSLRSRVSGLESRVSLPPPRRGSTPFASYTVPNDPQPPPRPGDCPDAPPPLRGGGEDSDTRPRQQPGLRHITPEAKTRTPTPNNPLPTACRGKDSDTNPQQAPSAQRAQRQRLGHQTPNNYRLFDPLQRSQREARLGHQSVTAALHPLTKPESTASVLFLPLRSRWQRRSLRAPERHTGFHPLRSRGTRAKHANQTAADQQLQPPEARSARSAAGEDSGTRATHWLSPPPNRPATAPPPTAEESDRGAAPQRGGRTLHRGGEQHSNHRCEPTSCWNTVRAYVL